MGTIYPTSAYKQVNMGSLFGEQAFLKKDVLSKDDSSSWNLELGASASMSSGVWNVEASAEYGMDKAQQAKENFDNFKTKTSKYSRGSLPPKSKGKNEQGVEESDTDEWLQSSKNNPAPTQLELESIARLAGIPEKLRTALDTYIQN